jgi:hypothetical protein
MPCTVAARTSPVVFEVLEFRLFLSRVNAVEGEFIEGIKVVVHGEGFGNVADPRPVVWAPMKDDLAPDILRPGTAWATSGFEWSREGPGGSGAAKANDDSGRWTMLAERPDWTSSPGSVFVVYKKVRRNFLITNNSQNYKSWRMWAPSYTYPNIYLAPSNGRVFTETTAVNRTATGATSRWDRPSG